MNTLSVLFPVHNAQGKLARGVAEILEVLTAWSGPFELCLLDDGSTDETADEARELAARFPQIRLIRHPLRLGLAEAVQTALDHTAGELVLVSHDDYELDPDDQTTLRRLRDTHRRHASHDASADPRPQKLLAHRPRGSARRRFDVIVRHAFEAFRLQQAFDTVRLDDRRPNPTTIIARRLREPKYLKMANPLAWRQSLASATEPGDE